LYRERKLSTVRRTSFWIWAAFWSFIRPNTVRCVWKRAIRIFILARATSTSPERRYPWAAEACATPFNSPPVMAGVSDAHFAVGLWSARMSKETWAAVEHYYGNLLAPDDAALEHALQSSEAAGLPRIQISALQGKLLHLLARMVAARNILEIGTLAGYSAIWMARALPEDGQLITLEANEKHAEIAQDNFVRAGIAGKIELRFGKALDTLPQI